jgi:membrane-anchored protein YejM (alkaline phosphatase superfamily)
VNGTGAATGVRNVVMVIADALRLDTFEEAMPRLAGDHTWHSLARYFTAAPWTLPACTSLLTGRDAASHDHFAHTHSLAAPTVVGAFRPERATAAFVNNRALAPNSGLFGDFDEYALVPGHEETFARAREYVEARGRDGRPYFLLVHSNLVHDYYLASTRAHYERRFPADRWFELGRRVIRWEGLDGDACTAVRRMYAACAAALDGAVADLLARIDGDTAVCFVSDHGEGLDPGHGRVHHGGRVHDDLLRVPCRFALPRSAPDRLHDALRRAGSLPAGSADVMPTLFDLAGIPVPGGLDGRSLLAGGLPADRPVRAEDRRYLYVRGGHRLNVNRRGKNTTLSDRTRNRLLQATMARGFRLAAEVRYPHKLVVTEFGLPAGPLRPAARRVLRRAHAGDPFVVARGGTWRGFELFDLDADPAERANRLVAGADGVPDWVAAAIHGGE